MKTKHLIKLTAWLCACVMCFACEDNNVTTYEIINYFSNNADFVVKNLNTGEQIENTGLNLVSIESIDVHPGDVIQLNYTPPAEYSDYSWNVTFSLFGEEFVKDAPAIMEYTIKDGEEDLYLITCSGVIEKSKDVILFNGTDYGYVYLNLVTE